MHSKFLKIIIFISILLIEDFYPQNSYFQKSPNKFNYGDSLQWKELNYNDSSWAILFNNTIENKEQFCWIRTNIYLYQKDLSHKDLTLLIDLSADYEIFWNGDKLGQNFSGTFENITKRGIYSESYSFSDTLVFLNKNVLSIRAKIYENNPLRFTHFNIADPVDIKFSEYKVFGHLFFLMFVYLVLLVLLVNYFRKYTSILLSAYLIITTFLMFLSLLLEYSFYAGIVGFDFTYFGDHLIKLILYHSLFSISFFFIEYNRVKYGKVYLFLILTILIISFFLDFEENYYLTLGLIPPILIVYFNFENKSFLKFFSISFFAIIIFFNIAFNLSIGNLFFLLLLFYLSVVYFKKEELQKNELVFAKLRSARLETEMLKKIIQPHYIMNSLNAVLELIEINPRSATNFIRDLSNEFRTFLEYSNKPLISIREEINLCKSHLNIMEMRQIRRYPLNITINNFNQLIPPAIFHTIIENGITHNRTKSEEINFYISEVSNNENVTYQIIVYYKKLDVPINLHEIAEIMDQQTLSEANIKVGTGINYVTARLTERYGENWELKCYETKDIWLTTIKIPIKVL